MNIGVVLKPGAPQALQCLKTVLEVAAGHRVLIEGAGYHALADVPKGVEAVHSATFANEIELLVILGGDGTLIHGASLLRDRVVPILGVNLGTIGFMTEVKREELAVALPAAIKGDLPYVDRMRLDAEVIRSGEVIARSRCLNDAVLSPETMARVATYQVTLGDELVISLRGDGVIIATPTGSTAYSMAAGGSLLAPGLEAVAITPICPHAFTQRPLVVKPDADIRVTLDSDAKVFATLDGQSGHEFERGDVLVLRRAPVPARVLSGVSGGYFHTLRTKLGWGDE
jgi:NAD+ kinase